MSVTKVDPRFAFESAVPLQGDGQQSYQDVFTLKDANGTTLASLDYLGNLVVATTASGAGTFSSVSGPKVSTYKTVTTTYPAVATDSFIKADATSAGFTVTLPTAASVPGQSFTIKKIDVSANLVTVSGNGANIDGAATSVLLAAQYNSITVISDGVKYHIIAAF